MQNQFISAAATASADGDRGLFYMACLSVDNLGMPVPMDERQAAELAYEALVRAAVSSTTAMKFVHFRRCLRPRRLPALMWVRVRRWLQQHRLLLGS